MRTSAMLMLTDPDDRLYRNYFVPTTRHIIHRVPNGEQTGSSMLVVKIEPSYSYGQYSAHISSDTRRAAPPVSVRTDAFRQ